MATGFEGRFAKLRGLPCPRSLGSCSAQSAGPCCEWRGPQTFDGAVFALPSVDRESVVERPPLALIKFDIAFRIVVRDANRRAAFL